MTEASYAEKARAKKAANAHAMGIDDALISSLVDGFYGEIRKDDLLGPIFSRHIADWPRHLERMNDFWASVTLESGRFRGSPMTKHIAIGGLGPSHFDRWLQLWETAVENAVSDPRAASAFLAAAKRIAASLLTGLQIHHGDLDAALAKKEKHSC